MPTFSERAGYTPTRVAIQHESLDDGTRLDLWNTIFTLNGISSEHQAYTFLDSLVSNLWDKRLRRPKDEQPRDERVWSLIKETILTGTWLEALDTVDAYMRFVTAFEDDAPAGLRNLTLELLNGVFDRNLVDCRFVDGLLVQIGDKVDVEAVASALESSDQFGGARQSIRRAAELLSDRQKPDYLNSIKEAISAVESVVMSVTGESTMSSGLRKLKNNGVDVHPALEQAWIKMYGWTSDADGIRHAAIEEAAGSPRLARYMLVACSAFVTYLIAAGQDAKLIQS